MSTQLTGTGPQMIAQKIYSSSSTQLHNYGEMVHTNDGRIFRYCEAGGTALVSGSLYQSKAENTSDEDLTPTAAAIGATTVLLSSTVTVDANEYAGGFMVVSITPGLGKVYRIKSHPVASAAAITITLDDAIEVALTTTSRIDLVANPYKDIIIQPTSRTGTVVGSAVHPITADQFGWIGVGGPQPVLADAAGVTVGLDFTSSDATDGAVEVITDAATELLPKVGRGITGIASGEVGIGLLMLH